MTHLGTHSYEIDRSTGQCALTDRELKPGEPYIATLVAAAEGEMDQNAGRRAHLAASLGFKRIDISWEAWQEGKRPDRLFGYWKTTVAEPEKKKKLFIDDDVLMNLFRRLAESDQPQRLAFRFVLGLILMRKKCLRYDGTKRRQVAESESQPKHEDWWQVVPKLDLSKGPLGKWNDDDKMEMLDPHLDEQQIRQVTEQIGEILEAEL